MILNITRPDFRSIVSNDILDLPKRWDGNNFQDAIDFLFSRYLLILSNYLSEDEVSKIRYICNGIQSCIEYYHNGLPCEAFRELEKYMEDLFLRPLSIYIYRKSDWTGVFKRYDPLMLYRIRRAC